MKIVSLNLPRENIHTWYVAFEERLSEKVNKKVLDFQ